MVEEMLSSWQGTFGGRSPRRCGGPPFCAYFGSFGRIGIIELFSIKNIQIKLSKTISYALSSLGLESL